MNSQEQGARLPSGFFMTSIISRLGWIGLSNFLCGKLCPFCATLSAVMAHFLYV